MLKEYRKTATINAEKFGTTLKQIEKYSLIYVSSENFYWIETKTGMAKLKAGDWIATGVDGEHWPISNEVFQQTYMEVSK
ncbi:hypothetical protein FC70_GL001768 [Paucilactobacillus oligofermentans DSM 15707 = LMG 22743]|uniref:Phage protein n=1 Tax=Paucilactobacillus oligofermentans DSM 15707 = LMG 22743 TaxID=1423778 RepID=A0A0R1RLC7_9LACO|nr:hypothetical protein [Paucilactobacillus oligofermentans]KRL54965.1 hypothetical protein FC70_GL001768 [Paucilactobacillus oligofermentans DSM 15707 = LMG 22743]CUS26118.1 Phage-like protein [Paucilactobacillus oligofermentans DSM 15707 = LMG 22743]